MEAGNNLAFLTGPDKGSIHTTTYSPGWGYSLGISVKRNFVGGKSIQLGLRHYSRSLLYYVHPDGTRSGKARINYLQLPIVFNTPLKSGWGGVAGLYTSIALTYPSNRPAVYTGQFDHELQFNSSTNYDKGVLLGIYHPWEKFKIDIMYMYSANKSFYINAAPKHFHTLSLTCNYYLNN